MRGRRDADDEGTDGLNDECLQRTSVKQPRRTSPADGLALYCTGHLIPPSTKVLHAIGRNL